MEVSFQAQAMACQLASQFRTAGGCTLYPPPKNGNTLLQCASKLAKTTGTICKNFLDCTPKNFGLFVYEN